MSIHTTDAIVLRRYPFRETSLTLTCLTRDFGKIKGLIKGIRGTTRPKYRSPMEPLTLNRIVFYDTRTSQLHLISQCELLNPLSGLQRELELMRTAAFFVDLLDHLLPLDEPQPGIYQLTKDALERLALGTQDLSALQDYFVMRLLKLAGFQPRLEECASCGAPAQGRAHWSARQGGLLCLRCLHQDPQAPVLPEDVLQAFALLSESLHVPSLSPEIAESVRQRLDEFLRWHVDRPMRSVGGSR
jgi:DNA repair protein RecO (recombination protein O)